MKRPILIFLTGIVRDCSKFGGGKFPIKCGNVDYGYPKTVFIGATGVSITAVGTVPTVAEMQTAVSQGIVIAIPISNGTKPKPELTTIDGADTADGLPEVIMEKEGLNGRLKNLNDEVRTFLQKLNVHNRVQLWYSTSTGYLFGEKTGVESSWYTPSLTHEGFGQRSYIDLENAVKFWRDPSKISVTNTTPDLAYNSIENPENLTLATIAAMAGGSAAALTIQMLTDAGVTGALLANLSGYKTVIAGQTAGSIDSLQELQIMIDSVNLTSA